MQYASYEADKPTKQKLWVSAFWKVLMSWGSDTFFRPSLPKQFQIQFLPDDIPLFSLSIFWLHRTTFTTNLFDKLGRKNVSDLHDTNTFRKQRPKVFVWWFCQPHSRHTAWIEGIFLWKLSFSCFRDGQRCRNFYDFGVFFSFEARYLASGGSNTLKTLRGHSAQSRWSFWLPHM